MGFTETIIIGFIISLAGNLFQYNKNQELQEELLEAQDHALENYLEWQKVVDVNDTNTSTITDLEKSGAKCSAQLKEALSSIHSYEESGRINRAAIDELQRKLDESSDVLDSDLCRVPEWVTVGIETSP